MFEYSALVDAPVQRFTGIVTGPDPDEDRLECVEQVAPVNQEAPVGQVAPVRRVEPTRDAPPALLPALSIVPVVAVALAVSVSALMWLRRTPHERQR